MTKLTLIIGLLIVSCSSNKSADENLLSNSDEEGFMTKSYLKINEDSIRFMKRSGHLPDIKMQLYDYPDDSLSDYLRYLKGSIYYTGNYGQEIDSLQERGFIILEELCDSGYLDACSYLTYCEIFNFNNNSSKESRHNKWLILAEKGNALAMYYLGTKAPNSENHDNFYYELNWLKKSCNLGHSNACWKLADYYKYEDPNNTKRKKYVLRADSLGDHKAKFKHSLFILEELLKNHDVEKFSEFKQLFFYRKYSTYFTERTFFETAAILLKYGGDNLKKLAIEIIIKTAKHLEDAKEFINKNNLEVKNVNPMFSYDELDQIIYSELEKYLLIK